MRALSTLLLILAFATQSFAHQTSRSGQAPPPSSTIQVEALTPEEEQEARALVELFIKKFAEKKDIGVTIDELFVSDFTRRLGELNERDPFVLIQGEVPLAIPPEALREYYIAVVNIWSLTWASFRAHRCTPGFDEKDEEDFKLEDAYPRDVIQLIKSEPLLLRFYRQGLGMELKDNESEETETGEAQTDERLFANAVEITDFTRLLNKCAPMLREHLAGLVGKRREGCDLAEDNADEVKIEANSMSDTFFGYDSGTRLICVKLAYLHLDLVRESGRLKIIHATPYF